MMSLVFSFIHSFIQPAPVEYLALDEVEKADKSKYVMKNYNQLRENFTIQRGFQGGSVPKGQDM